MKLYATVTSERASKGQGGNKQLKIDVLAETENGREVVGTVEMRVESESIHLISTVPQYKVFLKGEKQKGEECGNCGREATHSAGGIHRCDRCNTL